MLPKPLKAGQHSRCLVIKQGKKAQQEWSGHVSLPRVYCHKQVLLPNYTMTCCPALLCQSQAQDWLPPPAFEQQGRDQSTVSHPSFPAHAQLRVYSLSAVSSITAGHVHPCLMRISHSPENRSDLCLAELQQSSTFKESTCRIRACSDSRGGTRSTSFTHSPVPLGKHRNPQDSDLL